MKRVGSTALQGSRVWIASCAIALLAVVPLALAETAPAPAGTLDQIKAAATIRLGYRSDARPLSYRDESGNAAGYSVALCQRIAEAAKVRLGLADLAIQWVPVTIENRFQALQQGEIDLLCGAETATLARREEVSFSIPTFPGGIGALLRADATAKLKQVLSERPAVSQPQWRGTVGQVLQAQTFAVVAGTTSEGWVNGRLTSFKIAAKVTPVESYEAGMQGVYERKSNVLFGDRAILLDAAKRSASASDLIVLDRMFTYEPLALAFKRSDEDFRLLVDRTLSQLYRSGEISELYAKYCGEPDENALTFFRLNALPD